MKQRADWLAWSLRFIAGFIVGAILALYLTRRNWPFVLSTPSQHILMLVIGAALIGAGLASYYGDRLWVGSSYRAIPPDDIPRSAATKFLSILTGVVGGTFILLALLLNLHVI